MDVIEIKDPNLPQKEILSRLAEQLKGKTMPDFSTIGPESLRSRQAGTAPNAEELSLTHETMLDLMMMHQLEEPPFVSKTPVLGPWIVWLREGWNWMSTKWYVRPIMRQQSIINGQMVLLLMQMETILKDQQDMIAHLEKKVTYLETLAASTNPSGK